MMTSYLMLACVALLSAAVVVNRIVKGESSQYLQLVQLSHKAMVVCGLFQWSVTGSPVADVTCVTLMSIICNVAYFEQCRPTYTGYVSYQVKTYGPALVAFYVARLGFICRCAYGWEVLLLAGIFGMDLHDRWIAIKFCWPWLFPEHMRLR
jgi:hypothetical protein